MGRSMNTQFLMPKKLEGIALTLCYFSDKANGLTKGMSI